ncbi:hypothetical protein JOL62DRAFT_9144 [Phyllosticta paracitricarpa]|uniref:Uncharacterized protein n=1 Tax=Phyllosticta paracitricarpa TaxID=2016321 RepID=A0ABR1NJZ5_9PEZI
MQTVRETCMCPLPYYLSTYDRCRSISKQLCICKAHGLSKTSTYPLILPRSTAPFALLSSLSTIASSACMHTYVHAYIHTHMHIRPTDNSPTATTTTTSQPILSLYLCPTNKVPRVPDPPLDSGTAARRPQTGKAHHAPHERRRKPGPPDTAAASVCRYALPYLTSTTSPTSPYPAHLSTPYRSSCSSFGAPPPCHMKHCLFSDSWSSVRNIHFDDQESSGLALAPHCFGLLG